MKEQIEIMIAELEAAKDRRVFSTELANIGRESGLDTAIGKLKILAMKIDIDETVERLIEQIL